MPFGRRSINRAYEHLGIRYSYSSEFVPIANLDMRHPDDILKKSETRRKVSLEEADEFGRKIWQQ